MQIGDRTAAKQKGVILKHFSELETGAVKRVILIGEDHASERDYVVVQGI